MVLNDCFVSVPFVLTQNENSELFPHERWCPLIHFEHLIVLMS